MKDVTVILSGYNRPEYLKEQLEAVDSQTIKPVNVLYWQHTIPGNKYDLETISKCNAATINNVNYGVWARFYYALNVRTNYVMILDDDTIPGKQWVENCLDTHETNPGLLGTIGVKFPANKQYHNVARIGWDNPNEQTEQVDICGHSWFFHRDMLSVFCRELPPMNHNFLVGEDIHFSHMIQKYTDMKTWIPPHPKDNKEMWGSTKGWQFGDDGRATASHAMGKMNDYLQYSISKGFKLINE